MLNMLLKIDGDLEKQLGLVNSNEKSLDEDVNQIIDWLKTQSHLPEIMDKKMVRNFLIINKFSIEKAKQKIDMYYTIRTKLPDIYDDINPKNLHMKEAHQLACHAPLPQLTKDMHRVFVFKLINPQLADKIPLINAIKSAINFNEIRLKEDIMFGDIFIYDLEGATFKMLTLMSPMLMTRALKIYEEVYSFRVRAIYLINAPAFVDNILSLIKPFMKMKIFERIRVCKNTEILKDFLPNDELPKDYGGGGASLDELMKMVQMKFAEYENRFDELDRFRVNEGLRPEKSQNDEMFGFQGNFKQLNVD